MPVTETEPRDTTAPRISPNHRSQLAEKDYVHFRPLIHHRNFVRMAEVSEEN